MKKLLLCILCIGWAMGGYGQDLASFAQFPAVFNIALKNASTNSTGYTAKVLVREGANDETAIRVEMELRQSGTKYFSKFMLTDLPSMPEQVRNTLTSYGIDEVVTVVETSQKRATIMFPRLKSYFEIPVLESLAKVIDEQSTAHFDRIPVRSIFTNGITYKRIKLTEPGQSNAPTVFVWERSDWDQFPTQVEIKKSGRPMTIRVNSAVLADPPVTDFTVPEGFTRYDTAEELLKAARRAYSERHNQPVR